MAMCASSLNQLFFPLFFGNISNNAQCSTVMAYALQPLACDSLLRLHWQHPPHHSFQQEGGTRNLTGSGCYLDFFCSLMMPNATWQRFFTLIYVVKGKRDVSAAVNSQLQGMLTLLFGEGVCSSLPLSSLDSKKGIFYLSKTQPFPVGSWKNKD